MATVHDVAAYILDKHGPMSAMKLQKLCYFSYGYHLAWEDEQLFPERFEAWANGPVVRELYGKHRGRYTLQKGEIVGNEGAITAGQRESIDIVVESFGEYTAHELSEITHQGSPWLNARERSSAGPLDRSSEELWDDDIAEYFSALVSSGEED